MLRSTSFALARSAMPLAIAPTPTQSRRGFFTVIQQGTEAYRLFLGRDPVKLEPGLRLRLPLLHTIHVVDMREGLIALYHLHAYTSDNVPISIAGSLYYKVTDSYKAVFHSQDYLACLLLKYFLSISRVFAGFVLGSTALTQLGTSAARAVVGRYDYDQLNSDRRSLNEALSQQIDHATHEWGVTCTRFEIQSLDPQNENIKKQLELQVAAERQRRENELNVRAKINTAQGERDAAMLHAEGDRVAMISRAEGQAAADRLKADAAKYTMDTQTDAKTRLIQETTKAFGSSAIASEYLVEMARIEQLRALALGPNNTTYMLPSDLLKTLGNAAKSALDSGAAGNLAALAASSQLSSGGKK